MPAGLRHAGRSDAAGVCVSDERGGALRLDRHTSPPSWLPSRPKSPPPFGIARPPHASRRARDFRHIDPTGVQKGSDNISVIIRQYLYTAGDLAATMAVNVNLKVLSLNGFSIR
jgi:hypothetical protein